MATHTYTHMHTRRLTPAPITKAEVLRLAAGLRAEADRAETLQYQEPPGSVTGQHYAGLRQAFGVASLCAEDLAHRRPMQAPPLWHIDG